MGMAAIVFVKLSIEQSVMKGHVVSTHHRCKVEGEQRYEGIERTFNINKNKAPNHAKIRMFSARAMTTHFTLFCPASPAGIMGPLVSMRPPVLADTPLAGSMISASDFIARRWGRTYALAHGVAQGHSEVG